MTRNDSGIQKEQSQILYGQSPILFIVTALLAILVVWHFWEKSDHTLLSGWVSLIAILMCSRVLLIRAFKRNNKLHTPQYWLNIFAITAFLSGILWGAPLIYITMPALNGDLLLISFILTGMAAGCLVALSTYLPCYFSFSITSLLPFSLYLLLHQDPDFFVIGILVFLFLVSMIGFSFLVNRNVIDTIRLRFENLDLLDSLKVQKELAEKANVDKSRFLAATSHDLRQPLHALDLYLGALHVQLKKSENIKLVNKAAGSSQALGELLNALMDISKLDSGGVQVNPKYCTLEPIITSVFNDYKELAERKNITVETEIDNIAIHSDPVLLSRVLRNLLSNAIQHNDNCDIYISAFQNDRTAIIAIKDTGRGIAGSELDNIFSEFYQLNNPERDRNKGLGLGLAIVKRLSALLDISVDVESEVGKGSQFKLIMDVDCTNAVELKNTFSTGILDFTGLFFIVIDDEEGVRDAIKSLLRAWGCEVLLAGSTSELLEALEQDDYPMPDLIISDYRLRARKTGLETILAVRDYFKSEVPAIIITGDSSSEMIDSVNEANCHLLLKPVASQALRDEINKVLI